MPRIKNWKSDLQKEKLYGEGKDGNGPAEKGVSDRKGRARGKGGRFAKKA
ncbi:MAG: hypothetical protein H5U25_05545 [Oceanibaculum nanhaiense]|nr:hypothetical protein [Oceanibaculum nanhaiense]